MNWKLFIALVAIGAWYFLHDNNAISRAVVVSNNSPQTVSYIIFQKDDDKVTLSGTITSGSVHPLKSTIKNGPVTIIATMENGKEKKITIDVHDEQSMINFNL